jgi:hypothetical protein
MLQYSCNQATEITCTEVFYQWHTKLLMIVSSAVHVLLLALLRLSAKATTSLRSTLTSASIAELAQAVAP